MSENTKPKKPVHKRWWFIAIIVVVVAMIVGSLGDSNDDEVTPVVQDTTYATEYDDIRTESHEVIHDEPMLTIGDTATINNWEVTLVSVEFVNRVGTSEFLMNYAPESNKFLYATVTVMNMDTAPRSFLPMFALRADVSTDIIYDNTFTFTKNRILTYSNDLEGQETNPLTSTTGAVIYAIAERAVESDGSDPALV